MPPRPVSVQSDPQSLWQASMHDFKSGLLDHLEFFEKLSLICSQNLQDLHYIRDHATNVDIVNLYLKRVALS